MRYDISKATGRNWKRLNTSPAGRLTARANKRRSLRRFLPMEYFSRRTNAVFVRTLLEEIPRKTPVISIVLSLGIGLLKKAGLYGKGHVSAVLEEYSGITVIDGLTGVELPDDEFDILGLIYQSCLREGKKNTLGSYYTPRNVAENMTRKIDLVRGRSFFDPCCGSGAFLLSVKADSPENLFGVDRDPAAVLIAKINLLLKYADREFVPQIYCLDYLKDCSPERRHPVLDRKFDAIVTNPPWGAAAGGRRGRPGETFSRFFVRAHGQLKEKGTIRFLFPKAILNVKSHREIRRFILEKAGLAGITLYDAPFSRVTTKYVDIECGSGADGNVFTVCADGRSRTVGVRGVYETEDLVFNLLPEEVLSVIRTVRARGRHTLENSLWALGIVTGDNRRKLFPHPQPGMEAIRTGREIRSFVLDAPKHYILYDRSKLQQVAREEIYRAPEKLVYRFISDRPVFAYDDSAGLFLNSANILIPSIPSMGIKTVMAFLDSSLFRFVYMKLFGGVKVLKGNLVQLPFPEIPAQTDRELTALADGVLRGDSSRLKEIDEYIFSFYGIDEAGRRLVRDGLAGGSADGV
ncbi:MAG: N-6 DNA methylase [Lentisphaeria bacterium]|nr:N-6 DNA methylase [Lentisphaeria bacterium]